MRRLKHETLASVVGTACFTPAGIAQNGTTVANYDIGNAVDYSIDGKIYEKASTTSLALSGSDVGNDSKAVFLISLDSSGNVTVTQSSIEASGDDVYFPDVPDSECPIGAIKIETDSSTVFTPGTTSLTATGVTATFMDIARVPTGAE